MCINAGYKCCHCILSVILSNLYVLIVVYIGTLSVIMDKAQGEWSVAQGEWSV